MHFVTHLSATQRRLICGKQSPSDSNTRGYHVYGAKGRPGGDGNSLQPRRFQSVTRLLQQQIGRMDTVTRQSNLDCFYCFQPPQINIVPICVYAWQHIEAICKASLMLWGSYERTLSVLTFCAYFRLCHESWWHVFTFYSVSSLNLVLHVCIYTSKCSCFHRSLSHFITFLFLKE